MKDFEGIAIARAFSRSMIQLGDVDAELYGCDLRQIGPFGQVLTEQAVSVLVGAVLPGVVGMGEVDGYGQLAFEFLGTRELTAVVQGKAVAFMGRRVRPLPRGATEERMGRRPGQSAGRELAPG